MPANCCYCQNRRMNEQGHRPPASLSSPLRRRPLFLYNIRSGSLLYAPMADVRPVGSEGEDLPLACAPQWALPAAYFILSIHSEAKEVRKRAKGAIFLAGRHLANAPIDYGRGKMAAWVRGAFWRAAGVNAAV